MPRTCSIYGRKYTPKEKRIWKHIFQSAQERGATKESAAAQATAAIKRKVLKRSR